MPIPSVTTIMPTAAVTRRRFLRTTLITTAATLSACSSVSALSTFTPLPGRALPVTRKTPDLEVPDSHTGFIHWDDGRPIQISSGTTATCSTLKQGQLYGLFLYNTSKADHDVTATIVWSNAAPPESLLIPGTRTGQGPASMVFVSGRDTSTVSVSISGSDSRIECYIASVSMPLNGAGLQSKPLRPTGLRKALLRGDRYYAVLEKIWYRVSIGNLYTQAQVVQFSQHNATVYVVNPVEDPDLNILAVGTVAEGTDYSIVKPKSGTQPQHIQEQRRGHHERLVWVNASSQDSAQYTWIELQALSSPSAHPSQRVRPALNHVSALPGV